MFACTRIFIVAVLALLGAVQAELPADSSALDITGRIVGGMPVGADPIPYVVSLTVYNSQHCGGSILNPRTVVTAAHCLANIPVSLMAIHAGSKNRMPMEGVTVTVLAAFYNKNWTHDAMDYDVGLVRLKSALVYGPTIQPIRLATPDLRINDNSLATVCGWGYVEVDGPPSPVLRYARVPIVKQSTCEHIFKGDITDRMICAGYEEGGIDACRMDSGGPLVLDGILIGIVSWGVRCAEPNRPGVYTRVSAVLPWIQNTLAEQYHESVPSWRSASDQIPVIKSESPVNNSVNPIDLMDPQSHCEPVGSVSSAAVRLGN